MSRLDGLRGLFQTPPFPMSPWPLPRELWFVWGSRVCWETFVCSDSEKPEPWGTQHSWRSLGTSPLFGWQSVAGAAKLSVRQSSCYSLLLPKFISDGENRTNNQGKVILRLEMYLFFYERKKENLNGMIPLMVLWVVWGCLHARCWVLLSVFKEQTAVLVCFYHFLQSRGSSELSLALPGRNDLLDDRPELPAFAFPSSKPCSRMETFHGLHLNRDSPTPKQDLYPKILINCKS